MSKETERPLGLDRRPAKPPRRRLSGGGIALAAAALCVIAGSAAIALHRDPLRAPPRAVVSAPAVEAASPATQAPPASGRDMAARVQPASTGGPAIIRVKPQEGPDQAGSIILRDPSTLGGNQRFAHLPDRALIEESEAGPLPARGSDGRRPFDVYARPWSGVAGARIAILIGGLGLSQTGTQAAIDTLPGEITLAFAPAGNSLGRWMQAARRSGHEIMMQVPLEPFGYPNVSPGRNTLTVAASASQNLRELRWALSRITNYTGIVNYMGARFTAEPQAMEVVMRELGERGLAYLDDGTSARSLAADLALKNGVPFALADAVIDETRDRGAILQQLNELERIARARGVAIGTGSAFDVTVETVAGWAAEAAKRGIEIVPVSAVARDPERSQVANER